jgi:uridylate kinase
VYTTDPRHDKNAQKLKIISWPDFRALIPTDWDPGLSTPFDPIAAKVAEHSAIEVAIINGERISEVVSYLEGRPFIGTRIH